MLTILAPTQVVIRLPPVLSVLNILTPFSQDFLLHQALLRASPSKVRSRDLGKKRGLYWVNTVENLQGILAETEEFFEVSRLGQKCFLEVSRPGWKSFYEVSRPGRKSAKKVAFDLLEKLCQQCPFSTK